MNQNDPLFFRLFRYLGGFALCLFLYAQYQSWNVFQDSHYSGRSGSSSGSRVYHK